MTTSRSMDLNVEEEEFMTLRASKIPTHLETTKKCLIGKLFTDKPQVHATITLDLYGMWNKPKGFICEEVDDRIYRFYFDNKFDANTKLCRQPWNYKGQLLVLRPWEKGKNPLAYKFDHVPFKVQVWGLPSKLCTPIIFKNLCSHAGFVLEAEIYKDLNSYNSIPKAVVLIDVSKPLQRGAYLDIDDYDNIWVDFKYEKLPIFCYYCGKIGHEEQGCLELFKDANEDNVHPYKYGPELKAGPAGKTIDDWNETHDKQFHNRNQHLMGHKTMFDNVSQQLSSLTISQKNHGIINDPEFTPSLKSQVEEPMNSMVTIENLQPDMLQFNIGCNPNPSLKTKNKVMISGHRAHPYPSLSTLLQGPIHQDPNENLSMKRRIAETYEDKKGKRVCMDLS